MALELTLKVPATKELISSEVKKLASEIRIRQSEIEILKQGIAHYQKQCDHAGQKTGHNERDGSWGNPCPTCGYSY